MTEHDALKIITALASAFPAYPPARETVAVYVEMLSDLDFDVTVDATRDLILTEDRFPSVAMIRRRVGTRTGVLAPPPAQAWDEVNAQASDGGRNRIPTFTHPAVADTIRAIGWYTFCSSSNPETIRAQFLRMYEDNRRTRDNATLLEPGALSVQKELTS